MRRMTCKEAKATGVFSTILLLLTCFTTACQPTPESEIVVNKNNDAQNQQTMVTTAQPFSAPEQWTDSYEYYDEKGYGQHRCRCYNTSNRIVQCLCACSRSFLRRRRRKR